MIKRMLSEIAAMSSGRLGPGHIDSASGTPAAAPGEWADVFIEGVYNDSRKAGEGRLFVPLSGNHFDGHEYVEEALASGAAASLWQESRGIPESLAGKPLVLVDDPLAALQRLASAYRSQLKTVIVGITGSNGKTTTKDMAAAALGSVLRVHKTIGNLNNHIGLPLTVLSLDESTEAAVLEMGMSGLREIALLTGIARPDIAIITNIGDAHLLQLGSREAIAEAKLEIVEGLKPGGLLIVSADEPLIREGLAKTVLPEGAVVHTFGSSPKAGWKASDIRVGPVSTSFTVQSGSAEAALFRLPGGGEGGASGYAAFRVEIPVPGVHNVHNALAAIAAAAACGVPPEAMAAGLAAMQLTGMRIQPVKAANGAMILNDAYNANPTAVRAAVDLVAGLSGYRRKWIVLSDMRELGNAEERLHREIGAYITPDKADAVLTCGELSEHISEGAASSFGSSAAAAVRHFKDRESLISALAAELDHRDLVLVKGSRTMQMERVVEALQR
jgi:UDP-N-acetylmuramoyl-tripeptide--D-alanyl-D-alanine ligase